MAYHNTVRFPENGGVEVYNMVEDRVEESWDCFETDTGCEVHPDDVRAANLLCDQLNAEATNESNLRSGERASRRAQEANQ